MRNEDVRIVENLDWGIYGSTFKIRWMVTNFCNYACDFCIQGSREVKIQAAREESPETRRRIASKLIAWIERNFSPDQTIFFQLVGGEVTALPDFPELLSTLINCQFKGTIFFRIITNLSRSARYYEDLCGLFNGHDNRFLDLFASYYRAYTTPDVFWKKMLGMKPFIIRDIPPTFIQRFTRRFFGMSFVSKRTGNVKLTVTIPILDDDSFRDYLDFRDTYTKEGINVSPTVMRNYPVTLSTDVQDFLKHNKDKGGIRVTTSNGEVMYCKGIQQLGYQLEDVEMFYPNGYTCDAGIKNFNVLTDGTVLRCPIVNPPTDFYMGNLLDGTFQLLTKPTVCHAEHCSCNVYKRIERSDEK